MELRDLNYFLRIEDLTLRNKFCAWNNDLNMKSVRFEDWVNGSTLHVKVYADLEYRDNYTRDFVQEHFQNCCEEYIDEIIDRLDEDDCDSFDYVSYDYSLSLSYKD